jgi:hypothetical protein
MYLCAYSNNGLSFRWVLPEWDLEPGEVVFDHELSEAELALVFPGYVFKGWRDLQLSAKYALQDTDMAAIRCFKAGVAFPQDWVDYVDSLRMIVRTVSGDPASALPAKPDFPAGT